MVRPVRNTIISSHLRSILGVELRLVFLKRNSEVLEAIANGEGHIAAAGMTLLSLPSPTKGILFAPGYQDVDILVVCRRNHGKRPRNLEATE